MTITRTDDGEFLATSHTEPGRLYRLPANGQTCPCRGFAIRKDCRHRDGVREYQHTYDTRLALLGCLGDPTPEQHALATADACQTVEQMEF